MVRSRLPLLIAFVFGALILYASVPASTVNAAKLSNRTIEISSSVVGATNVTYALSFGIATAGTLGSISVEFCSNDPLVGTACTAPTGFDASAVTITSQTGETGFSIAGTSTANRIVLGRAPAAAGTGPVSYDLGNITNPSVNGSYYARLQTYATNDGSGADTDSGGLALSTTSPLNVTTEVPPYLLFCSGITISNFDCGTANGSYINLGNLTTSKTSSGTSQFVVATNAGFGYGVTVDGTTLTSGNDVIPALTSPTAASAGASQFGINFRANTSPSVGSNPAGTGAGVVSASYNSPNLFKFNQGDNVVSSPGSSDFQKFTASYIANMNKNQPGGYYTTTISYICLASF